MMSKLEKNTTSVNSLKSSLDYSIFRWVFYLNIESLEFKLNDVSSTVYSLVFDDNLDASYIDKITAIL